MEKIWNHIYQNELKVESNQNSCILSEAPLNPKKTEKRRLLLCLKLSKYLNSISKSNKFYLFLPQVALQV